MQKSETPITISIHIEAIQQIKQQIDKSVRNYNDDGEVEQWGPKLESVRHWKPVEPPLHVCSVDVGCDIMQSSGLMSIQSSNSQHNKTLGYFNLIYRQIDALLINVDHLIQI